MRSFVLGFSALARDEFDVAVRHFEAGVALNHANPPMNADIERVIAAIRRLLSSGQGEPAEVAPASPEDAHVLLAAYRQSSIH